MSTTALRYLKVALEIKDQFGNDLGNIVEIGCGYGGQAIILDRVANVSSYNFFDLWQVNLLITRFVESSSLSCNYSVSTLRSFVDTDKNWDLAISNYAFSELPASLQDSYLKKVLSKSRNGYLTMNSREDGGFLNLKNHSQKFLANYFENAWIDSETL